MDSDEIVREWWMPVVREGGKLDWLCDHEGDYLEKIEALWEAYIALQAELAEREQTERDLRRVIERGKPVSEREKELSAVCDGYIKAAENILVRAEKAEAELASVKGHAEALENIESSLRRAGATLPAPEPTGTIEGAMNTGLCIALCVVVDERRRAMGAAVSGGGEIIGVASASATNSCATTHSQECPPHEQKQPQPAHPKDAPTRKPLAQPDISNDPPCAY